MRRSARAMAGELRLAGPCSMLFAQAAHRSFARSFQAKDTVDALHDIEAGECRYRFRQRRVGGLVGDDDDPCATPLTALVDNALLAHLGDADLALAEFRCDSR